MKKKRISKKMLRDLVASGTSSKEINDNFRYDHIKNFNTLFKDLDIEEFPWLDFSNAESMYGTFRNCKNLKRLPEMATRKVKIMSHMCSQCYELRHVPFLETPSLVEINYPFSLCRKLEYCDFSDVSNVKDCRFMFTDCKSLVIDPFKFPEYKFTLEEHPKVAKYYPGYFI